MLATDILLIQCAVKIPYLNLGNCHAMNAIGTNVPSHVSCNNLPLQKAGGLLTHNSLWYGIFSNVDGRGGPMRGGWCASLMFANQV